MTKPKFPRLMRNQRTKFLNVSCILYLTKHKGNVKFCIPMNQIIFLVETLLFNNLQANSLKKKSPSKWR